MVSLGNARGQFVDHGSTQETEPLLESSTIISSEESTRLYFRPIPIIWAICSQLLLLVLFEILTFVLPVVCSGSAAGILAILIYTHVVLWVLLFSLDWYLHRQHRMYRRKGYLEFYQRTSNLRRATPFVIAIGNTVLLVVVMLLQEYCVNSIECPPEVHFKQYNYVQIVGCIEVLIAFPMLVLYLSKAIQFNRQQASPDVEQEDLAASYGQVPCTDIGFRDVDRLDEVLEKQADLIRYLKQHNASLGKKIVKLTSELRLFKGQ